MKKLLKGRCANCTSSWDVLPSGVCVRCVGSLRQKGCCTLCGRFKQLYEARNPLNDKETIMVCYQCLRKPSIPAITKGVHGG